jgi:hypothetical protein
MLSSSRLPGSTKLGDLENREWFIALNRECRKTCVIARFLLEEISRFVVRKLRATEGRGLRRRPERVPEGHMIVAGDFIAGSGDHMGPASPEGRPNTAAINPKDSFLQSRTHSPESNRRIGAHTCTNHTVPTGRFFWGGAFPGTSCQATINRPSGTRPNYKHRYRR